MSASCVMLDAFTKQIDSPSRAVPIPIYLPVLYFETLLLSKVAQHPGNQSLTSLRSSHLTIVRNLHRISIWNRNLEICCCGDRRQRSPHSLIPKIHKRIDSRVEA